MKNMGKWFWAFVGVSVALIAAIVVAIVVGTPAKVPEIPEGPETGTYYFDADNGTEYLLELYDGNKFVFNDGVVRLGEYTVTETGLSLVFDKESNGTATATYADDVVTMDYLGAQIRFLRKVSYTVAFDTAGGNAVESATVVNGRPVAKPADPAKDGFVFVGWYTDAEFKTPYIFTSSIITSDATLYARFVEKAVGQMEYEVTFEGADVDAIPTLGGKVFGLPTPTKEGYTFGGWWTSDFNDAEKLTAKCEEGDAVEGNTVLYALWLTTDKAPAVEVDENGVKWAAVSGVASYAVKITDPNGTIVYEQNTGTTVLTYDFTVAGEYVVEVTAGTETATRYYNAKALSKVSVFEVIDPSTLLFNTVAGAEKYFITIKCGNPAHNHDMIDNGNSNVYNFANCEMKEGGIEFVVTATARGFASSVSTTFVYEKKLDAVTQITVDAETDTLVWTPVGSAAYYLVQVGESVERVYGNTYSLKNFTGDLTIKITPVTDGFLSPEATTHTYKKATLQAPTGLTINGMVVSWNAVEGATGYNVKVGSKVIAATGTTLDLSTADVSFLTGETVRISVMATGTTDSQYSDELVTYNQAFTDAVLYKNGYVYWTPVVGDGNYEIKVNGGNSFVVSNDVKAPITFTQAGLHTISVRFASKAYTSEWVSVDVMVYSVTFDVRQGAAVSQLFVAADDLLTLPNSDRTGYTFDGWYTTPSAAAGNGKLFDDEAFGAKDNLVLYANWIANKYNIVFDIEEGISGVVHGDKTEVTYNQKFTLPVPDSEEGTFLGWFSGPGGSGYQVADAAGESVKAYNVAGNTTVYPFFEIGALTYVLQPDGTYGVKQGPNIKKTVNVIIPETYEGVKVSVVLENAFKSCQYIKTVSIPNTVTLVGSGAFSGCKALEEVNVRVVEGTHEVFYSSHEGALIRNDMGTTYLEYFPRSKSGEYTIPEGVDAILNKAFQYAYNLEVLNIGTDVTYIAEQAFFHCYKLREVNFVAGGTKPLEIEDGAFLDVAKLTRIVLPARLVRIDGINTLNACKSLQIIVAEEGGEYYGAVDGMLTNGVRDTILYCPPKRQGAMEIPVGITNIAANAFANRTELTSLVIPNWVESIGANAFAGCTMLKSVEFLGGRYNDLTIESSAFAGNKVLSSVTFAGVATMAAGKVIIGDSAFENCEKLLTLTIADNANVVSVGASAFKGCNLNELRIAATISSVGNEAFANCEKMTTVAFAENCADIEFGTAVFTGCSIKSVSLPSTIRNFNGAVFQGCDTIAEIKVDAANPYLESVNGVLYNKGQTELLFYPQSKAVDFATLPATLTAIGPAAFQGNANLTEIVLPANITTVGANAFDGCRSLTSVTFAATEGVTIGSAAFANCSQLSTVVVPDDVKTIADYAFSKTALANFDMPSAVEYIGAFAFESTKLTTLDLPATLTTIGDGAFTGCTALTSVTIAEGEGAPLTIGVISTEDYKATGAFKGCSKLTTVNLPARIKLIGSRTFQQVSSITAVNIPDGAKLETIGDIAFYGLSKITAINLPEGLKTIGDQAFYGCNHKNHTTLTIPSTVEYIGYRAFYNSKLTTVNFAPTPEGQTAVPLNIGNEAFYSNSVMTEITLPARVNTFFEWLHTDNGTEYPSLYKVFGSSSGKLKAINIEEGNPAYMSIDGVVYQKDMDGNPAILLHCPDGKTGTVTVPSTVVQVAYRAFHGTRSKGSQVSEIIFEEKEDWDGTPTLVIGMVSAWDDDDLSTTGGVFTSDKITRIVFPRHLKEFNAASFNALSASNVSIEFAEGTKPIRVGAFAFHKNCTGIKELHLPPVSRLENHCFDYMTYLHTLTFGEGSTVTEMGEYMLWNTSNLTAIKIPASVRKLNRNALYVGTKLTTIEFEEGSELEYLAYGSIYAGVTTFTIPETVETIEGNAFNCSKLKTLVINSKLKTLVGIDEASIFRGCSQLEEIVVPESNPYLVNVDGMVCDKNITTLFYVGRAAYETTNANGKLVGKNVQIPSTITSIETYAFMRYAYDSEAGTVRYPALTTIELPEGLIKIGNYAFSTCASLKTMTIPASVEMIGNNAFYYLNLEEIKFAPGSNLTKISNYAFSYNPIKEISFPDTVMFEDIDYNVMGNCTELVSANLPTSTLNVPKGMFSSCGKLQSVTLHEGLEFIGYRAFQNCDSLTTINIPASVVEFDTWVGSSDQDGPFDNCDKLAEIIFAEGSQLTKLGAAAFQGCVSLKSIILPEGVNVLNPLVFDGCVALEYLELNGTWTDIPANYFTSNKSLKTVVLSESARNIGAGAFDGCANLTTINFPAELVTIGDAAFRGTALTNVSFGPALASIGNYAFDGCADLAEVTFDSGCELTSLGDFADVESAIFRGTTSLKSIVLPSTVRTMGASVFENSGLETIELSTDLSAISNYAFKNCVNLTYMAVPEFVSSIGDYAFEGCTALITADIAEGVETMGSGVFRGCTNLETTNIPKTVKEISGNPYVDCPNLSNFTFDPDNAAYSFEDGVMYDAGKFTLIYYSPAKTETSFTPPESVVDFAVGAFNCSQLVEITLPSSMKKIPALLFSNSAKLANVTIPAGVKEIGDEAFSGCTALTAITIPYDVTKLGMGAFAGASKLSEFTITNMEGAIELGDHLFDGCSSLTSFTFPAGTTSLSNYLFAGTGITEMTIPATFTSLDFEGVFANSALTTITFEKVAEEDEDGNLGDPVDHISGALGDKFFYNCKNLASFEFPAGINAIGGFTAVGMQGGTTKNPTPRHLYASEAYTFAGCTSLTTISVKGIRFFGNHAFDGCTALETVIFPESSDAAAMKKFNLMGDSVFANCTSLKSVDMSKLSGVEFTLIGATGEEYTVNSTYYANFGSRVFENCTSLEEVVFPGACLGRIGTHLFDGCTSLQSITNLYAKTGSSLGTTGYFEAGARPFYGIPKTCKVAIKMDLPDLNDTEKGLFITTDDDGVVSVNHDWIKDLGKDSVAECRFNYTYYTDCVVDENGMIVKLIYDDTHSHNQGCEECAYLRSPTQDAQMKQYLALGPGEKVENVQMTYMVIAEITKPYDPETSTTSFIAYWGTPGYFNTPIVCNNVVGSGGASMVPGMTATVKGNIVLIDGTIHYEDGATLVNCRALNFSSGRYAAGLQLQMLEIPTNFTEETRIAMPHVYSLPALEDIHVDWEGYYWESSNEDVIRFEQEFNEDGVLITYMVVTPQATEQNVTIEASIAFWGQTFYFRRYNVVVAAK